MCYYRESSEKDVLVDLTQVWNDRSVYISSLSIERQLLTPERPTSHIEVYFIAHLSGQHMAVLV